MTKRLPLHLIPQVSVEPIVVSQTTEDVVIPKKRKGISEESHEELRLFAEEAAMVHQSIQTKP